MVTRRQLLGTAFFALLCHCTQGGSGPGETSANAEGQRRISVKGSDTMVILGQRWAEAYARVEPKAVVQVTGGGTGTGIAALINGSTDICQASRPMTSREKDEILAKRGSPAVEVRVAIDALSIYVNAENPLTEVSVPNLARVYTGEFRSWKDIGGKAHSVVLYGRENSSGTQGYFKDRVLGGKEFAVSTQTLGGTAAIASAVKADEFGIGYGGIAYLEGIKALKIQKDDQSPAVAPSLRTALDGSYPLSRYLYFYTVGEPLGEVKRFIEWVGSPEGQRIIGDVGYYPLP